MAKRQEVGNTSVPDSLQAINIIAEQNKQQQYLLLSTTYPLNNSNTKKLHVGLQLTKEGTFEPIVKLTGNYAEGISFDSSTWRLLQENMGLMKMYLSANSKIKVDRISFENISVGFTTAYGTKAIMLTYKENENFPKEDAASASTQVEEAQPATKKRKIYSSAIVMQQATFRGMEKVIKCVDAYINQLVSIIDNTNECARYLIQEIDLHLTNSYIDAEIIKLTFRGNKEDIERRVRTQIKNLTFLDTYFNILFLELTELKLNEIVNIVLRKRGL